MIRPQPGRRARLEDVVAEGVASADRTDPPAPVENNYAIQREYDAVMHLILRNMVYFSFFDKRKNMSGQSTLFVYLFLRAGSSFD